MWKTPEFPVDLARVLYQCKSCGVKGGVKEHLKHKANCEPSFGGSYEHVCTKSGKYPHSSKDAD